MNLKLLGQNLRTRISTIVAIGAYLNMVLATFDPSVIADNPTAIKVYQWASMLFALCAWINSHYYNQDYSVEMDTHTKLGRQEKANRDFVPTTSEEPLDASIEEESEVEDGDE